MRAATTASPPVSLGLPVYNGQRFVAQMLDSVCSQTFGDFELVISDNASTDATEEICLTLLGRIPGSCTSAPAENRGAAWNHNIVIHLSGGEFFKWIADDDICAPTFLQRCIETFRSEPPVVVLVYPQSTVIDEHGNIFGITGTDSIFASRCRTNGSNISSGIRPTWEPSCNRNGPQRPSPHT